MEINCTLSTLTFKICASIEAPPEHNRERFRQGVLDTVLHILRTEEVGIEYIGYNPDNSGTHPIDQNVTEYDDCIYVSFNVCNADLNPLDNEFATGDLLRTFINIFEDKTHRHIEVDSTVVRRGKKQRMIEMSSDWKLYLSHG